MKKFNIKYGVLALLAAGMLAACQDDPQQPAPKFSFQDGEDEILVRRDTIDKYTIKADIAIPNGGQKLVVMNGFTYQEIETIPISGTEYRLNYLVDFSAIDADTTLIYLFKVIDNTGRTMNDAFSINMIQSSRPVVKFRKAEVSTWYDSYPTIFEVSTGFNTIKSIQVMHQETVLKDVDVSDLPDPSFCAVSVMIMLPPGVLGTYEVTVRAEDHVGKIGNFTMKIHRVNPPATKLDYFTTKNAGGVVTKFTYAYDAQGRISQIASAQQSAYPSPTVTDFFYDELEPTRLDSIYYDGGTSTYTGIGYHYRESGELDNVTMCMTNKTTGLPYSTFTWKPYVSNIEYEDGRIKRYYANTRTIDAYYATLSGEQVMGDVLSTTFGANRNVFKFIDKTTNPFYFPEFPPVHTNSNNLTGGFYDFFVTPYMPSGKVRHSDNTSVQASYATTLDGLGRVSRIVRTEGTQVTTLDFVYKN